jgi:excisionase family DNA binding protein
MEKLVTGKELIELLGISESTLIRLRKKGLPYKKVGLRAVRYDYKEVLEWLNKGN